MKTSNESIVIVVGTRVSTNLYNRGMGTIYEIHGEQRPESIRQIGGGVGAMGGNASYDIVFDCGSMSSKLPECILHGVQWTIYPELFTEDQINESLAHASATLALANAAKSSAEVAYQLEVERLKTAPEYATLNQGDDKYSGKLAATNIRIQLKLAFPKVKFSVRKRYHGSVDVEWTDGPTGEQVDAIIDTYKSGHFDGMIDLHSSKIYPFHVVFGGADYVSTTRNTTPELAQKAINIVFEQYPVNFQEMEKPTGEMFKSGSLYNVAAPRFNRSLQDMVWSELRQLAG